MKEKELELTKEKEKVKEMEERVKKHKEFEEGRQKMLKDGVDELKTNLDFPIREAVSQDDDEF